MEDREVMQMLSERLCNAHARKKEFVEKLITLMGDFPIDREIKYDFRRTEPIPKDAQANN